MSELLYAVLAVAISAVVTAALRFIPFLIFGSGKQLPGIIFKLGKRTYIEEQLKRLGL